MMSVGGQLVCCTCKLYSRLQPNRFSVRLLSQGPNKSFFSELINNIRTEMTKNKEMKENLKKFREEADKLEQSDSLKKAREKYESIQAEADKAKKTFGTLSGKIMESLEEIEKSDIGKKSKNIAGELGKTASKAAESAVKHTQQIGSSAVYRSVSQGVKAVKEEIDQTTIRSRAKPYRAPETLRRREVFARTERAVEADEDTTGMVLHKDSKWFQSWQNFKDNNQYVSKLFDLKMRYDESDNVLIRATRTFTDKVSDVFGGVFVKTEMSEVLTEIVKLDPSFEQEEFIRLCQLEIIPNVLEAMVRGDLEILSDWCHEAVYNTIAHPIKQAQAARYTFDSRVLDVNHVDIAAGKMMEQGPVLVISFNAQQIMVVRDSTGKVVEGDPEKIMRVFHVWALCRDQNILDPKAAWRVVDLSYSPSEQWL